MFNHISVLSKEVVDFLKIKKNGIYIDCSFGLGGHSKLILSKLGKYGRLIAIDRDPESVLYAKKTIKDSRFLIKKCLFSDLKKLVISYNLVGKINGILLDLGISSYQINNPERGFSFIKDGPLDMRMDQTKGQTASEWLKEAKECEIEKVLRTYGEEKFSKKIAKAIFLRNSMLHMKPILRTKELSNLIIKNVFYSKKRKHPARKTFQAIRIHINNELKEIEYVLKCFSNILMKKGRVLVISFHSLEGRIIKNFIKKYCKLLVSKRDIKNGKLYIKPIFKMLNKIKPTKKEIINNPSSRSSILRVIEKI